METLRYQQLDYVLRLPENFSKTEKYPLVVYLHGAGGRGRDLDVIVNHPFFSCTKEHLKGVVSVAPQCYENSWFTIFEQLQRFLEYAISLDYIDKTKVYLVGASMGGYTTWQMAESRPELFAAIIPICGGGMYWNAARLKAMGVWAFHGDSDLVVFPEESKKMVDKINEAGGNAKLTIYKNTPHNAWTPTFEDAKVWEWLLSHSLVYEETAPVCQGVKNFG